MDDHRGARARRSVVILPRAATAVVIVLLALVTASTAGAQPTKAKVFRLGVLGMGQAGVLRDSLREAGYVEGSNLIVEWRDPEGHVDRFTELAVQLVQLHVDAIVAAPPAATLAARRTTAAIPIVMVNTPDPVNLGRVRSLARPGGNVTGTTTLSADLTVKQLQLLREAVPHVSRIGIVLNPSNPWHPVALKSAEAAARSMGVQLQAVEVRRPEDFDNAFATMAREQVGAALALSDPMTYFHRVRIADLAITRRLPTMHGVRGYVDAGGLMSYWANQADLYRRVVSYVDRIFKFRSAVAARDEAIVILSSPMFNTYRRQLVELAAKYRLPAIMPFPLFADDGGLIAYGPDIVELYRQGGAMVGRVLKGARPSDLPVERPSRFVLAVNKKTARSLGVTVPQSILIRADKVID